MRLYPIGISALLLAGIAPAVHAQSAGCGGLPCVGGASVVTNTVSHATITHDTPATAVATAYRTELTGRLFGGPTLFDQTLPVSFNDPAFGDALLTSESQLSSSTVFPLTFIGPSLV